MAQLDWPKYVVDTIDLIRADFAVLYSKVLWVYGCACCVDAVLLDATFLGMLEGRWGVWRQSGAHLHHRRRRPPASQPAYVDVLHEANSFPIPIPLTQHTPICRCMIDIL